MKRTIQLAMILFVTVMVTVSCKKEMTNDVFENGSATIQGTALVNTNLTNDTAGVAYEAVPQGVAIYAMISTFDLVEFPSNGANYGVMILDTVVGANGSFSFSIPANQKNVSVSFSADDFRANQIQFDESVESKVFTLPAGYSESVHDGVTRITEVIFQEK